MAEAGDTFVMYGSTTTLLAVTQAASFRETLWAGFHPMIPTPLSAETAAFWQKLQVISFNKSHLREQRQGRDMYEMSEPIKSDERQ